MNAWLLLDVLAFITGLLLTDAERSLPVLTIQVIWLAVTTRGASGKTRGLAEHLLVTLWLAQALLGIYIATSALAAATSVATSIGLGLITAAALGFAVHLFRQWRMGPRQKQKHKQVATEEERAALITATVVAIAEPAAVIAAAAPAAVVPEKIVFEGVAE